jgi:hypothetical protein
MVARAHSIRARPCVALSLFITHSLYLSYARTHPPPHSLTHICTLSLCFHAHSPPSPYRERACRARPPCGAKGTRRGRSRDTHRQTVPHPARVPAAPRVHPPTHTRHASGVDRKREREIVGRARAVRQRMTSLADGSSVRYLIVNAEQEAGGRAKHERVGARIDAVHIGASFHERQLTVHPPPAPLLSQVSSRAFVAPLRTHTQTQRETRTRTSRPRSIAATNVHQVCICVHTCLHLCVCVSDDGEPEQQHTCAAPSPVWESTSISMCE